MYQRSGAYIVLFFVLSLVVGSYGVEHMHQMRVHVLLDKKQDHMGVLWTIQSPGGFWLSDPLNPTCRDRLKGSTCEIAYDKGILRINGRKLAIKRITIEPFSKNLRVDKRWYAGSFTILTGNESWYLVNSVDLEEYVFSVLCSESWPGWPLEVNKTFAIAVRSFVVGQLLQARAKKKQGKNFFFDIGCTNLHQTYKGLANFPKVRQAVEETRGLVLAHNNKPIIAMYDVCCGGVIPSKIQGVDFRSAPYLARSYPCTFCADCKLYSWKATYSVAEFERLLHGVNKRIKQIRDVKISHVDPAGIVHEIKVKCGKMWISVPMSTMYSLFKGIRSYCFTISLDERAVVIEGRGYGHHKGMCQWGARKMIKEGWNYREVLDFYYPGTKIMKLEVV